MDSINVVGPYVLALNIKLRTWTLMYVQGKYDQALRDYKKGSFLNSSKSGQLIPGLPANTPAQKAQHKRVFDKVWTSVEKIMSDMKGKLYEGLKDPNRAVEEQERTIE